MALIKAEIAIAAYILDEVLTPGLVWQALYENIAEDIWAEYAEDIADLRRRIEALETCPHCGG